MGPSRIYVTTLCLAAVVLLPVPGFSASPNAAPQASADKAKDDGCGKGGQEPSPRAEREPKRQNAGPKPKDCSRGQGGGPESDDPSNEESDMKSNGGFVGALMLALVAANAGATDGGIAVFGCHKTSQRPGVQGATIPGQTLPGYTIKEGELFCLNPSSPNRVCSPRIEVPPTVVPPTTVDGVPPDDNSDLYCARLSSIGSGATAVADAPNCQPGTRGVVVYRSSSSSFTVEFTKNGEPVLPFPVASAQQSQGEPQELCVFSPG